MVNYIHLQQPLGVPSQGVMVIYNFNPIVGVQTKATIPAQMFERDGGAGYLPDWKNYGAVFTRPLEGCLTGFTALVDLHPIELVFRPSVLRFG